MSPSRTFLLLLLATTVCAQTKTGTIAGAVTDASGSAVPGPRLELRAEFFNLTNSVHFGKPVLSVDRAQGGTITSTASPNRQIQLGLRFVY